MKRALAILFSVALVLTQSVSPLNASIASDCAPQKHCCCGKSQSCCTTKSRSDSETAPALPAPTSASSQLQLALPASRLVFRLADFSSTKFSFAISPVLKTGAVSLYQRNCVYLI
jgi:hypothetical protein